MLTKILFTIIVVIGVALYFRTKKNPPRVREAAESGEESAPSTRTVVYILLVLMVAVSIGVFVLKWQQDNRIIEIRVTTESGEVVNYQARHKDISGRSFLSLEGVQVTLGAGDRVETLGY
ncbi:MAG: hypothetical protein F4128_00430 [Gammaproteobacteria bacterium]|nr:hypothetical protein [Gammaproteobacteria bacterium]